MILTKYELACWWFKEIMYEDQQQWKAQNKTLQFSWMFNLILCLSLFFILIHNFHELSPTNDLFRYISEIEHSQISIFKYHLLSIYSKICMHSSCLNISNKLHNLWHLKVLYTFITIHQGTSYIILCAYLIFNFIYMNDSLSHQTLLFIIGPFISM